MNAVRGWLEHVAGLDVLDVCARLTLLLVVLHGGTTWDVDFPVRILAAVGLVDTRLLRHPRYWLLITVVLALGNVRRILVIDNHKVLLVYWCFALTLCLRARSGAALAHNARWLIGLAFGFATFWKLASPDFADGTFFTFILCVGDHRFAGVTQALGGLSAAELAANRVAYEALRAGSASVAELHVTDAARTLAWGMALWTIAIEAAVALAFLLPHKLNWVRRARNPLLLVFLITTYPIATVIGFGWQLALLGYAQTDPEERWSRLAYLACVPLLILFLIPWSDLSQAL